MKDIRLLMAATAILLLSFTFGAQSTITNGLVSYYLFDGNANDAVGTNNGIIHSVISTSDRATNLNSAYSFDGSDSSVNLPDPTLNNLSAGTLATWVQLSRNTQELIFAKQHDGVDSYGVFGVGIYCDGYGNLPSGQAGKLYFRNHRFGNLAASSALLSTGLWHHVAVAFSPTNCIFYIDGIQSDSLPGNFSLPNVTPFQPAQPSVRGRVRPA